MLTLSAPAKINLHLHITGRADNGYHHLDSLVVFTDVVDHLTFSPADSCANSGERGLCSLEVAGDTTFAQHLKTDCNDQDNLIVRAAHHLAEYLSLHALAPVNIRLEKHIPLGGGLGGGSSDAATTLLGLNRSWNAQLSVETLHQMAAKMGSDIAACLTAPTPILLRDTGNTLLPAPKMPECYLVLVNPMSSSPTPAVYKRFAQNSTPFSSPIVFPDSFATVQDLCSFLKEHTQNDLTAAAESINPDITGVLHALATCREALLTRLSGSGSTCYAIFANKTAAHQAATELQRHYPDWWITPTRF